MPNDRKGVKRFPPYEVLTPSLRDIRATIDGLNVSIQLLTDKREELIGQSRIEEIIRDDSLRKILLTDTTVLGILTDHKFPVVYKSEANLRIQRDDGGFVLYINSGRLCYQTLDFPDNEDYQDLHRLLPLIQKVLMSRLEATEC